MSEPVPLKFALWLLKAWGSPYYSESLAGDLIEQFHKGRTRAWCWRQVAAAIVIARAGFIRRLPWTKAGRVVARLIAETAAVLALTLVIDQGLRARSMAGMTHPIFLGTLAGLVIVVLMGLRLSDPSGIRKRTREALQALMLAFGVVALGAGTLTWAGTTLGSTCRTDACICPGN